MTATVTAERSASRAAHHSIEPRAASSSPPTLRFPIELNGFMEVVLHLPNRAIAIYSRVSFSEKLRLGVTLKSVTLGNVTMSHRTRERPPNALRLSPTQL
ncbi:hypothetical protein EVAR_68617_1 [Eumeta japonica]|uniref:Uncharacterized protein n=1 Tax=Eumeta variegata TaxID=151549 RepID=A0A4C2AE01_EUMVA|nr:hypothetical protein EVAR_68617_1 [Eumeta japonica]